MSDHEGEGLGLERWEEASLPGGSIYSYAPSDVFTRGNIPGDTTLPLHTAPHRANLQGLPDHGRRGGRPGPALFGSQNPAAHVQASRARTPPQKNAAEILFDTGIPPKAEHRLTSTWRAHSKMTLRTDRGTQSNPLQQLRDIMVKFDTFVKRPDDQDGTLLIWGEPEAVAHTQEALADWELHVREAFMNSKQGTWVKSYALDGRAEHRLERQSNRKALNELIQQAEMDYAFQAALLWPKDLDIEDFEKDNLDVLDVLRETFYCRIGFQPSDEQHILVEANSEAEITQIMSRILNLIKENISRRDQLVTVNLIHLPQHSIHRDRVGIQEKDPRSESYLPTLHGHPAREEFEYLKERRTTHANNRKKVKKTVDSSIKRLRLSQQHVRIRVVFGELGFTLFQKPANGAETYSFEDFYAMVTKGRTKVILNGLPVRQGNITDLPDILDSMDAFSDRTERYGVYFDFPAATANSVLRLEAVIVPADDAECEIREQRWLEINDTVAKLQVSLFNFEKPDYQVTMDAFPLYSEKSIKSHMLAFQGKISFERPPDGIKAIPRRRVKYPYGAAGLRAVSELTVLRWRFKSTDGFFELRRKDVYDERAGTRSPGPAETRWHALYYYPEWDNLMGEFANIKPGEDISWAKSVATFFPESGDSDGRALPQGFKKFLAEVEEIQDLLAEAIGKLAT